MTGIFKAPVSGDGITAWAEPNEASIRAVAAAVRDAGGGRVMLPPQRIPTTSALHVYRNVEYHGFGTQVYFWTTGPQFSGTVIDCQGLGHNGFEWNAVDLSAQLSTNPDVVHATECHGAGFFGINVTRAKDGWRFGGNFNGGVSRLKMDNCTAYDCSGWGFWLENCHRPSIGRLQAQVCAAGHFMMMSSTPEFFYGNGEISHIHTIAGSTHYRARQVVLGAKNTSNLNGMTVGCLTAVGNGILHSEAVSGAGTVNIAVANVARFAPFLPVYFTADSAAFTAGRVYFVRSVSGDTGAGTIQVSAVPGGPAISASGSLGTIHVRAGAGVEIGGMDAGSFVTGLSVANTDTEDCGITNVMLHKVRSSDISIGYWNAPIPQQRQLVMRDLDATTNVLARPDVVRLDNDRVTARVYGSRLTSVLNQNGVGLRVDHDETVTNSALYLGGSGRAIRLLGHTHAPVGSDRPWANVPTYIASGGTIGVSNTSHVVWTGSADGAITLPEIAANLGVWYEIVNPTAFALTVNTSASQTINNATGVTSQVIPARTSATFRSCRAANGSGAYFWMTA